MAYASRSGRAVTNPTSPRAFAVCQRCGIWTQRDKLINQPEWRGSALLPLFIWVCPHCLDVPQEQNRAIIVPADPVPVYMPFPEPFSDDETTLMTLAQPTTDPTTGIPIPGATMMTTTGGAPMTPSPIGRPDGLTPAAMMPRGVGANGSLQSFDVVLPILSLTASGTDQISATCSAPHGLSTGAQISAEGLTNALACGIFSVVVTSATAFTYQTYAVSVPNGSLLGAHSRLATARVGVPRTYVTVPQVGP